METLESRAQRILPCTPRHKGKFERINRLMRDEVIYTQVYASESVHRHALAV